MTCSAACRLALRMSCTAAVSYGVGVTEIPPGVAAELARLREENARLLKMLELSLDPPTKASSLPALK
jgi:hypothetical protein